MTSRKDLGDTGHLVRVLKALRIAWLIFICYVARKQLPCLLGHGLAFPCLAVKVGRGGILDGGLLLG
ncbi:hypothetical protein IG631_12099 [Alternaria alternata]|nr:hypothetical protein IG631_12099 [Alternaria alternata]